MKGALALVFVVSLMATAGCANMAPRQQRALSGGDWRSRWGGPWGDDGRQSHSRGRHRWGCWGCDWGSDQIAPDWSQAPDAPHASG
jgi:hypothetical protein